MKLGRTRVALLAFAALSASGCSIFKKGAPKTPVVGERVDVLTTEQDVVVDPATAQLPLSLPEPIANTEWAQAGGNATKSMGHLAIGQSLGQAWEVSIGQGSSVKARLAAAPVVANGQVFTVDTQATVRAFDAQNGGQQWATQFGVEKENRASLFGGGVAADSGRVYVTNGLGFVAAQALELATKVTYPLGAALWLVALVPLGLATLRHPAVTRRPTVVGSPANAPAAA